MERPLTPKVIRFAAAALAGIALLTGGAVLAIDPLARELVLGDRPELRVEAYLAAIRSGDEPAARAVWDLVGPDRPGLAARRDAITGELVRSRPAGYRVQSVDWWTTCCDPHRVDGPRNAGLARFVVSIDGAGTFVFDVLARTTTYWGDAGGNPPHEWTLRDVYEPAAGPLWIRVPRS